MSVTHERHGTTVLLTINRPEARNALDRRTLGGLTAGLTTAGKDPEVLAVVVTGAGDRAFSAGLDLKELATVGVPDPTTSPITLLRNGYPLPVIAAVNGPAIGGGFELALACDLVIMADHAYFSLPEVGRGITASEGGTELPLRLPLAVALELGLTGGPLPARRAGELGLVNRVLPAAEVLPTALDWARRIGEHSPAAILATKTLMHETLSTGQRERREHAHEVTRALLAGPDATEGAAAFLERRQPRWAPPHRG